jgi:hypothetical protein
MLELSLQPWNPEDLKLHQPLMGDSAGHWMSCNDWPYVLFGELLHSEAA